MKYFSMFSGIGGFELGIQRVCPEWKCIGHSEVDKYADVIYSKHFSDSKNYGDATKIDPEDLPDIDMICGGFPCQSFSIAGKRGGIEYDTRGTLFKEIVRIAEAKRPGIIFLENVKGLLSSQEGWDFYVIQDSLVQLGYELEWEVLNTKNFGIPQNRERVFIIGHLGKECGQKVFPVGRTGKKNNGKSIKTLRSGGKGSLTNKHNYDIIADYRNDISMCPPLVIRQPLRFLNRNQKNIEGDYSFTIDGSHTSGIRINNSIRRLTPIECERLQGFPDNWTAGISDAQRYKCCGNAVTVDVISAIVEKIKGVF
jgi:DNA (cytosine-5)-methyltransferase 1